MTVESVKGCYRFWKRKHRKSQFRNFDSDLFLQNAVSYLLASSSLLCVILIVWLYRVVRMTLIQTTQNIIQVVDFGLMLISGFSTAGALAMSFFILVMHDFFTVGCLTEYSFSHFINTTSNNTIINNGTFYINNNTMNNFNDNNSTGQWINKTSIEYSIITLANLNKIYYSDNQGVEMKFHYPDELKTLKELEIYSFAMALLTNFVTIAPVVLLFSLPFLLLANNGLDSDLFLYYVNVVPPFILCLLLIPNMYLSFAGQSIVERHVDRLEALVPLTVKCEKGTETGTSWQLMTIHFFCIIGVLGLGIIRLMLYKAEKALDVLLLPPPVENPDNDEAHKTTVELKEMEESTPQIGTPMA